MLAVMSVPPDTVSDADETAAATSDIRRVRRTVALAVVAVVVVLGATVAVALTRPTATDVAAPGSTADTPPLLTQDAPPDDEPLPAATLPPLGDLGPPGGLDLSETGGEPMVINFWASWCVPCVEEMPMLQRVADDLDIRMIGVDYIDQADKAVALAEELGIRYPLVRDDEGSFGQQVGLLGTPTTLLVDADGIVRRRLTGELTEAQLRTAITDDLGGG